MASFIKDRWPSCKLPIVGIKASLPGFLDKFFNVSLSSFQYLPVVIATKNIISGNQYENGDIDFYLFFGKAMPQESVPVDWESFKNYPTINNDYDIIANIILSYPSFKTSGTVKNKTNTTYNLNNASIVFIGRKADNFVVPPIGDVTLVDKTLQDVIAMTEFTRSDEYKNIYDKLGADLVAPFTNFKTNGTSSYVDINNNSFKKTIMDECASIFYDAKFDEKS